MLMLAASTGCRGGAFVSENWIFPASTSRWSRGPAFFGEGMCFDLALANVIGDDMIAPGVPYVDVCSILIS